MLQTSVTGVEIDSPNGIDLALTVYEANSSKSCVLRPEAEDERVLGKLADAYNRRQAVQAAAGQDVPITPVELTAYVIHPQGKWWRGANEAHRTGELARQIVRAIS